MGSSGSVSHGRADATAWSELYHQLAPLVIGYLRAQRLPDPDDVAGEVMLELVRDLGRFSGDADGFRSWVLTIAHHRLLDARRREAHRPATPTAHEQLRPSPSTDDPEAETLAAVALGALVPALERLTEDQRTVLLLRVIGDLSIAEVATIMGRQQVRSDSSNGAPSRRCAGRSTSNSSMPARRATRTIRASLARPVTRHRLGRSTMIMDLLTDDQRITRLTRELGDLDLAERLLRLRREVVEPVPERVAEQHLTAMVAASRAAGPTPTRRR